MNGAHSYDFLSYRSGRNGLSPLKESINENDKSESVSPFENIVASANSPFRATVPSSAAFARGDVGLRSVVETGKQKHMDLDSLMGEFNHLMTQLHVPTSSFRAASAPQNSTLLNSLDPNQMKRKGNYQNGNKLSSDYSSGPADTDDNSADDSAAVAIIRQLSAKQLRSSSSAESGALQSEITAQMMRMYTNNLRRDSSPPRSSTDSTASPERRNGYSDRCNSSTEIYEQTHMENSAFRQAAGYHKLDNFSALNSNPSHSVPIQVPMTSVLPEGFTVLGPQIVESPLRAHRQRAKYPTLHITHDEYEAPHYRNVDSKSSYTVGDDNVVVDSLNNGLHREDGSDGKSFPSYFNARHEDEMRHRHEREEREREQDGGGYSGPVYDVRGDNNTANISSTNGYRHGSQYNVEELENEFEGRERLWETNAVDASAQLNARSYAVTERDRGAERERERERERGGNKESEGYRHRDRGGRRYNEGDGDEDRDRDAQRGLSHLHFMDRTHDNTVRAPPNTYEHVPMNAGVSEHHVRCLDSTHSEGNGTQSSRHPYNGGNGTSTSGGMDREEGRGTEKGREGDVMRSGVGKADWDRERNEGRERASREMERNGSIGDGWTDRDNVNSRNNHQHHSQSQSQLEAKNVRNRESQYQTSSHRYEQHNQLSHNHNGNGRYAEGIVENNNYREGSAQFHTMSNITPLVTHHNGSDEQQNYPDQHQIYREEHQKNYNVHQNHRCDRQGGEDWRAVERSEDKDKERDGDRGWSVPSNFESRYHPNELKGNSANISPPPPPSYSSSFVAASAPSSSSSSLPSSSSSSSSSRYKSCPTSTTAPLYTSTTSSLNQTERLRVERERDHALLPGDDSEGEREVGDSDSMRRVVNWTDKIHREKENIKIWEEQMEREIENKQRGRERGRDTYVQKKPDNHEEEEGEGEEKGGNRRTSGDQYTGTDNGGGSGSGNYGRDNDSTSDSKLHSDRLGYKEELRRLQVCI